MKEPAEGETGKREEREAARPAPPVPSRAADGPDASPASPCQGEGSGIYNTRVVAVFAAARSGAASEQEREGLSLSREGPLPARLSPPSPGPLRAESPTPRSENPPGICRGTNPLQTLPLSNPPPPTLLYFCCPFSKKNAAGVRRVPGCRQCPPSSSQGKDGRSQGIKPARVEGARAAFSPHKEPARPLAIFATV